MSNDGMSFLEELAQKIAGAPDGVYNVEVVPGSEEAFDTQKAAGVKFTLVIASGEYAGNRVNISFFSRHPIEDFVTRDMNNVIKFARILGIGKEAAGLVDVISIGSRKLYSSPSNPNPSRIAARLQTAPDKSGLERVVVAEFLPAISVGNGALVI
jgi:hypothetical protein